MSQALPVNGGIDGEGMSSGPLGTHSPDTPSKFKMVMAADLPDMLDPLKKMLERTAKRGGFTAEAILHDVYRGKTILWLVGDYEGVVIGKIIRRPLEDVLWIDWLVGDNFPEWIDGWFGVQNKFAALVGCKAVEFSGRIGWKKYEGLRNHRFKPVATVYRQEIDG